MWPLWRILSRKALLLFVFFVLSSVLIITRIQSSPHLIPTNNNNNADYFHIKSEFKDEDGMHYYQNGKEDKPMQPLLNYPFDDNDDDDGSLVNHDDFDGLPGPNEQQADTQKGQVIKDAKNATKKKQKIDKIKHGNEIISDITCDVNHGKYVLDCKKDQTDEVFVPFSFLQKYYEIFGKTSETDPKTFNILHSQVKIFRPKQPYNPKGVFTFFENYNVEVRDRVKCLSGAYGVPISTQWDRNGYFYAIQIAQFGLSHYSKYLTEGEPTRVLLENGDSKHSNWISSRNSNMQIISNPDSQYVTNDNVVEVHASETSDPIKLLVRNHKSRFLHLSWKMRIKNSGTDLSRLNVTLTVDVRYENQIYHLHYTTADFLIRVNGNNIYHGLGFESTKKWQHVIRDLGIDVQKGVSQIAKKNKILKSKLVVESISIANNNKDGIPFLFDNMTLSTNEHLAQFFQAIDWFVLNQDLKGGWPIPVKRKFGSEFFPVLQPGWYSSMAMGHGLSLLARAYALTKNELYAKACSHALETIFDNTGEENKGVRAVFLDQLTWYEEYPTTPSTFVLNGFMYSLLGLYDVWQLQIPEASEKAKRLYEDGLHSLITMLPLFDTGSGTMYDLRHFTIPGITPNLARMDYHVTHINQLLTFATIHDHKIFSTTAERWIKYTEGFRAPHN